MGRKLLKRNQETGKIEAKPHRGGASALIETGADAIAQSLARRR